MNRIIFLPLIASAFFALRAAAVEPSEIGITRDITPGNTKPIPVSLSGITGEAADVIQFDLYVQGFSFVAPDAAQFLISGSANANLTGNVTDKFNKSALVNKSYTGASLRRQAHTFVNDFLAAIGRKGIGGTKIAYKADKGSSGEICVADFDGGNPTTITHDNAIVAAPDWVPGRLALYYTSYKLGSPEIFRHDLSTGQRTAVARHPGSNMSPAASPDGSKVAMILSKDGAVDVYVASADGSNLKRLTKTKEDDSSPCWSPDGQWICYATRVKEGDKEWRLLYKVPASGGAAQRISTGGIANPSEPDWSPDGKWIVFTAQMGEFEICVVPAAGGTATLLVSGEDPSWAPNSRTVVYVRRQSGGRILSLLDVPTKQTKDVSRISGSNSQPSWAR